ncbi:hypothetical protein LXL04_015844 [Taraxacum kok-saghyz]
MEKLIMLMIVVKVQKTPLPLPLLLLLMKLIPFPILMILRTGTIPVSCYLNNEEESRFKKIIWEQMNKEYMQEQAAKEAAAAAARKLYTRTSEEIREPQAKFPKLKP